MNLDSIGRFAMDRSCISKNTMQQTVLGFLSNLFSGHLELQAPSITFSGESCNHFWLEASGHKVCTGLALKEQALLVFVC